MSQELQELRAALERERAAHAMTTTLLITARAALNSEAEAHIQTRVSQVEALREAFQQSQQVAALEARLRAAEAELEATRAARDAARTALDAVLAARDDAVTWAQYF
jgi:hypothetical protein